MSQDSPTHVLTLDEVSEALASLSQWELKNNKLHRKLQFNHFNEAFGFMTRVALQAESLNHHPDWSNTYNQVIIDLYTHSKNGITNLDIQLAQHINSIL